MNVTSICLPRSATRTDLSVWLSPAPPPSIQPCCSPVFTVTLSVVEQAITSAYAFVIVTGSACTLFCVCVCVTAARNYEAKQLIHPCPQIGGAREHWPQRAGGFCRASLVVSDNVKAGATLLYVQRNFNERPAAFLQPAKAPQ